MNRAIASRQRRAAKLLRDERGRAGRSRRSGLVCRQPPPVSRCSFRFLSLVFQALIFSNREPFHVTLRPSSCISVYTRVYTPLIKRRALFTPGRPVFAVLSCSGFPPTTTLTRSRSPFASSGLYAESSHRAVSMSIRDRRPSLPSAPRTVVRRCA